MPVYPPAYQLDVLLPQNAPGWVTPTMWVTIAIAIAAFLYTLYTLQHPGWGVAGRSTIAAIGVVAALAASYAGNYTYSGDAYADTASNDLQHQLVTAYGNDLLATATAPQSAAGYAAYRALNGGTPTIVQRGGAATDCLVHPYTAAGVPGTVTPARTHTRAARVVLVCSGAPMLPAGRTDPAATQGGGTGAPAPTPTTAGAKHRTPAGR